MPIKFIPNLSSVIFPLNRLLCKDQSWEWTKACKEAFQRAKELLSSQGVLAHYNPKLPLYLAADASSYGIGAVISHKYEDGSEKPIAFASRTLTSTERNYAQLEKEALAIIFGVKKFHKYIYGRPFVLVTDHKPLTTIFHPHKGIPPLSAARLQRWALTLSALNYTIEFKRTQDHANADALSRLPRKSKLRGEESEVEHSSCFNISQIEALLVTASQLGRATRKDPILSRVMQHTHQGWPPKCPDATLQPYWNRRQELSIVGDCLLWGSRVIIPASCHVKILHDLHQEHTGMSRMKAIARSYFWWPSLDKAIESIVSSCESCQAVKSPPPKAPLHPWIWPTRPWERVHVDFAGPFRGRMFLLLMDAHSKWPEIIELTSTTASKTIDVLREIFSRNGLPEQIVSDNGPQFVSEEFGRFMKENAIKHIRISPYHPASNGAAERLVQTFKQAMRAMESQQVPLQQTLSNFLLMYRSTPHSTTGETPSKLFLGRQLRTRFDLLLPDVGIRVRERQAAQKQQHDSKARSREIPVGSSVTVKDFRNPSVWKSGVVVQRTGPLSYRVRLDSGQVWRKHVDHLRQVATPGFEYGTPDVGSNHSAAERPMGPAPSHVIPVVSVNQWNVFVLTHDYV